MRNAVTRDEAAARARFRERYGVDRREVNRQIERAVIGGDWDANSYTTMSQADELGRLLGLAPGRRLLDVGAGRGWPGLYLARTTGCEAVLTDLTVEGLRQARRRAAAEGLEDRVSVVAASAAALPLRPHEVDAVVQTDVLC